MELEEFLELKDGEQLRDLDSIREVTMEDFLELDEWLEDMDQNSKKKLDEDQYTSRGDLKTSPNSSIDQHQPDENDRQTPHHRSTPTIYHRSTPTRLHRSIPTRLHRSTPIVEQNAKLRG